MTARYRRATQPNGQMGLYRDLGILALSIFIAIMLVQSRMIEHVITATSGMSLVSSFIAGIFFTSIFTTAPAIAALYEIVHGGSPIWQVAIFGALGAMVGDYLMFVFMRDAFADHLGEVLRLRGMTKRLRHFFRRKSLHRIAFVIGGLIIASPLPDELGLSLLGLSKTKTSWFLPLSFVCNLGGIVLIGLAARTITS